MKKTLSLLFWGVALLALLSIGDSYASDLQIGRMRVAIWPEFDDPGILVIYDGRFVDDGSSFPVTTTFLVPKGAEISDACSLSPKGQHFCQLFKQKRGIDMDEITLKLPYPNFYLSFHIKPFDSENPQRKITYNVLPNHITNKLEVDIQRPLRAEEFSIIPGTEEKEVQKEFEHFFYTFNKPDKGTVIPFEITYRKDDNRPSVNIKYSPMSKERQLSSYEERNKFVNILYIAASGGFIILAGLFWLLLRGRKKLLIILFFFAASHPYLLTSSASALTVNEVASELECPCECPLVLEDCNMSCGLKWKEQIGEMIKAGKTKEEIIKSFMDKYGNACKITPIKRIRGKFFQYTRAFDTTEWVVFWSVIVVWVGAVFLGIYLLVRRFLSGGKKEEKGES